MLTPKEYNALYLSGILRGLQIAQELALISKTIIDFKANLKIAELVINSAKEVRDNER